MKKTQVLFVLTLCLGFSPVAIGQDKPVDIPKSELPKKAICLVCSGMGEEHGEEKPAAGVRFKGSSYYFCNVKEVAEFKKDPESFLPPVLPRPMAKFDLKDESGKLWNAAAFENKVVLIDFWATWCGPCREMKPIVEKVHKSFSEKGLEVLSVSIDEKRADLDKFLAKNKFGNPVVHDSVQTWAAWKVRAIPTFFLVKNGQIVAQWTGKVSEKKLAEAVQAALVNL